MPSLKTVKWVTVTGIYGPGGGDLPHIRATAVAEIDAPDDPYE